MKYRILAGLVLAAIVTVTIYYNNQSPAGFIEIRVFGQRSNTDSNKAEKLGL